MKKVAKMIVVVMFLSVISVCEGNIFTHTAHAETDYSTVVDIDTLEKIKDDKDALSQVKNILIDEYDKDKASKIKDKLNLISLCPNLEYIRIYVKGMELDKTFFEYINSSKNVTVSLSNMSIDFKNVRDNKVTGLYLNEMNVYNFKDITNLKGLCGLQIYNINGLELRTLIVCLTWNYYRLLVKE